MSSVGKCSFFTSSYMALLEGLVSIHLSKPRPAPFFFPFLRFASSCRAACFESWRLPDCLPAKRFLIASAAASCLCSSVNSVCSPVLFSAAACLAFFFLSFFFWFARRFFSSTSACDSCAADYLDSSAGFFSSPALTPISAITRANSSSSRRFCSFLLKILTGAVQIR